MADPSQDQKFFDLLNQKDIPPVDNDNSLIAMAKKACSKLDDGMSVGDLVELIRNNGFNENPLTRLQPQGRITRTIDRFINASVEAYCPKDRGKIASIAGIPRAAGRALASSCWRHLSNPCPPEKSCRRSRYRFPCSSPDRCPKSSPHLNKERRRRRVGCSPHHRRHRHNNPSRPGRGAGPGPRTARRGTCARACARASRSGSRTRGRPGRRRTPAESDAGSARAARTHQARTLRH